MGKQLHRLSNVDLENKTAICYSCGLVKIYVDPGGERYCEPARLERKRNYRKTHKEIRIALCLNKNSEKGNVCTRCGFIAENPCQLDIDHIDGDRYNNSMENLQTLCANCHRLKSINDRRVYGKKRSYSRRYVKTIPRAC